jgi:hypothetical protein
MGWLRQFTPPNRYDPVWMRLFIENVRTAVNSITYRTCNNSPVGTIVPDFVGEEILDIVNKIWYKSVGTTSADWKQIT